MSPEQTRHAAEVMMAASWGDAVEVRDRNIGSLPQYRQWRHSTGSLMWDWHSCEYRIAPEPEQPKRIPLSLEDWKGVWWVKRPEEESTFLVAVKSRNGIVISACASNEYFDHEEMTKRGWLRSQDEVNWSPCWKTV